MRIYALLFQDTEGKFNDCVSEDIQKIQAAFQKCDCHSRLSLEIWENGESNMEDILGKNIPKFIEKELRKSEGGNEK